ncbi:hypothetical protein E2C01_088246 [Portunus trituberculatus]|uniref:Uncharacterized protein n=1 Tax=Portunus trituberculatus TaxID=210409 RepID=A0A5B7JLE5_PORTR|nr:hypothetical protein [Portunus trituberculatus]
MITRYTLRFAYYSGDRIRSSYVYGPLNTMANHLYELGCEWNYREKLCSLGSNRCKHAQQLGVGLLHGASLNSREQKFQVRV